MKSLYSRLLKSWEIFLNPTLFIFLSKPLLHCLSHNLAHISSLKSPYYTKKIELRISQIICKVWGLKWRFLNTLPKGFLIKPLSCHYFILVFRKILNVGKMFSSYLNQRFQVHREWLDPLHFLLKFLLFFIPSPVDICNHLSLDLPLRWERKGICLLSLCSLSPEALTPSSPWIAWVFCLISILSHSVRNVISIQWLSLPTLRRKS